MKMVEMSSVVKMVFVVTVCQFLLTNCVAQKECTVVGSVVPELYSLVKTVFACIDEGSKDSATCCISWESFSCPCKIYNIPLPRLLPFDIAFTECKSTIDQIQKKQGCEGVCDNVSDLAKEMAPLVNNIFRCIKMEHKDEDTCCESWQSFSCPCQIYKIPTPLLMPYAVALGNCKSTIQEIQAQRSCDEGFQSKSKLKQVTGAF